MQKELLSSKKIKMFKIKIKSRSRMMKLKIVQTKIGIYKKILEIKNRTELKKRNKVQKKKMKS
jgi:hypothetical protein